MFCFFKQKTADEMRISDWSSNVCSSDLRSRHRAQLLRAAHDHLVDDAVIGTGKQNHRLAPGHRTCDAQCTEHRLGTGVAQLRAVVPGHDAYQPGHVPFQRILRTAPITHVTPLNDPIPDHTTAPAHKDTTTTP